MNNTTSLSFDDILLAPGYSDIESRSHVDLSTSLGGFDFTLPIISSPMDTVTGGRMAAQMCVAGGLGIVHRGQSITDQVDAVSHAVALAVDVGVEDPIIGAAIGIKEGAIDDVAALVGAGAKIICIDVCHGHHKRVGDLIKELLNLFPGLPIIAGNVATHAGAAFLADAGVDAIRVGIGNGSICSTRLQCGAWCASGDSPY